MLNIRNYDSDLLIEGILKRDLEHNNYIIKKVAYESKFLLKRSIKLKITKMSPFRPLHDKPLRQS